MTSFYDLGDVVTLTTLVRDQSGALADATAVTATVAAPDGTSASPVVTKPSTGTYTLTYVPSQVGVHEVTWTATGDNAASFADVFTVSTFAPDVPVSLAEAKNYLNITSSNSDEEIRRFLLVAVAAVERQLRGRVLRPREFTEVVAGRGRVAVLPHLPVSAVESVTEDGKTVDTAGYRLRSATGVLERLPVGRRWEDPVEVTYTAGSNRVPADLVQACLEMLRHLWTTQRGALPMDAGVPRPGSGYSIPNRVMELIEPHKVVQ